MIKFYHAPYSRSTGILWLLEELDAPYEIEHVNIRAPGGVPEAYRKIQAHKKVPAIQYEHTTITERAAISIFLADTFSVKKLAPNIGDPLRGPYLSSLVYSDSVMDPTIAARAQGWDYRPAAFSFGSFDDMITNVETKLSRQSYAVGEHFSAADTQLASALHWAINLFKIVPRSPVFDQYFERVLQRPAFLRAMSIDQDLASSSVEKSKTARYRGGQAAVALKMGQDQPH